MPKTRKSDSQSALRTTDSTKRPSEARLMQLDQIIDLTWSITKLRQPFNPALMSPEVVGHRNRLDSIIPAGDVKRRRSVSALIRIGLLLYRQKEPLTMGELSKASGLPLSTTTRVVDGLVKNTFAERSAEADDRRVVRVALTKDGRELYDSFIDAVRQRFTDVLAEFTDEERELLRVLLRRFVDAMDKADA